MLWKFILIGLGMTCGDVLMKQWVISGASLKDSSILIYFLALVVYGASLTTYAYQLFTTNISIATITPILVNVIIISLLSFFYYKESISAYQGVGILLAFCAIALFSIK